MLSVNKLDDIFGLLQYVFRAAEWGGDLRERIEEQSKEGVRIKYIVAVIVRGRMATNN